MALTIETLTASIIKQHRRKGLKCNGYYLLSPKQTSLFSDLMRQRVAKIEKLTTWNDGKFVMNKDGVGIPTLYRYGKSLSYPRACKQKSMALIKADGKSSQWFKTEGCSILQFI